MQNVKEAIDMTNESYTATGIPGAMTASIPGSPAYNLRKK